VGVDPAVERLRGGGRVTWEGAGSVSHPNRCWVGMRKPAAALRGSGRDRFCSTNVTATARAAGLVAGPDAEVLDQPRSLMQSGHPGPPVIQLAGPIRKNAHRSASRDPGDGGPLDRAGLDPRRWTTPRGGGKNRRATGGTDPKARKARSMRLVRDRQEHVGRCGLA